MNWFTKIFTRRRDVTARQPLIPPQQRVQLLVDALRSGEYVQGNGALHDIMPNGSSKFCCLGVACQVAIKNGLPLHTELRSRGMMYGDNLNEMRGGVLPDTVAEWFGFDDYSPDILDAVAGQTLAVDANDGLRWDFNRIADGFERAYITHPELFKRSPQTQAL